VWVQAATRSIRAQAGALGLGTGRCMNVGLDYKVVSTTNHHKMFDIVTADEDDASFPVDRQTITVTRAGALRRRSQLSMCFLPHSECRSEKQFGDADVDGVPKGGIAAASRQPRCPDLDTGDDLPSADPPDSLT
jgi:hypothetical protein